MTREEINNLIRLTLDKIAETAAKFTEQANRPILQIVRTIEDGFYTVQFEVYDPAYLEWANSRAGLISRTLENNGVDGRIVVRDLSKRSV